MKLFWLAAKDLQLLLRDKATLFWVLGWPLLFALFFGSIFSSDDGDSGGSPLHLVLVDQDGGADALQFSGALEESDGVRISRATEEEARSAVRLGKQTAFLLLKPGFRTGFGLMGGLGGTPDQERKLVVGFDPSRRAEAAFLQGVIASAAFTVPAESSATGESESFDLQVDFEEITGEREAGSPRSAWDITFPAAMIWAILGCIAGFAATIVRERTSGTWLRLQVAPLSSAELLLGKLLASFTACIVVACALLLFAALVFGLRADSGPLLFLALVVASLGFSGLMMFLATMGKTEASVSGSSWGILLIMAMLGGGMIPLIAMPEWMQRLSRLSPVNWAITSFEGAIWRGMSLAELAPYLGALLAMGLAGWILGAWRLKAAEV